MENEALKQKVTEVLQTIFDPEIPVNIVDLGLVYRCSITPSTADKFMVDIDMTLTAPGCGMGPVIAADAKQTLLTIPEIEDVHINIVFDPPWEQSMMSDIAKLELGLL